MDWRCETQGIPNAIESPNEEVAWPPVDGPAPQLEETGDLQDLGFTFHDASITQSYDPVLDAGEPSTTADQGTQTGEYSSLDDI